MMKKVLKIAGIAVLSIVGIILIGLGVIWINSPGKLNPLKDGEGREIAGAVAEKTFITIGGIDQGFFLRGENPENPVILFLHGGPGSPELPMLEASETSERLEKYFTVCYWDQRGSGMSYNKNIDPSTMTVERMVEDTRQMSEYLRERFGQQKIVLMGHSWGSYLGIKTIEKYPELYSAYIGIGQVTNQLESEKLAYDYMLAHATEIGDKKAVEQLEKFDNAAADFPSLDYLLGPRTLLMNKYGIGMMHEGAPMLAFVGDVLLFKGYTFGEKISYPRGSMSSLNLLSDIFMYGNLFESDLSFTIPVYIVQGRYDYQTSHALVSKWFDIIDAPEKKFITFENSAHSPNLEEPERFVQTVCEIVAE